MVVTRLIGGLGNQLFQYATGRSLSLRLGTELKLDLRAFATFPRKYALDRLAIQAEIAQTEDLNGLKKIEEKGRSFCPEVSECKDPVYLDGYWANERYFLDVADVIREDFRLKGAWSDAGSMMAQKIQQDNSAVSLHIRRGDYFDNLINYDMFGICTLDYYTRALRYLETITDDLTIYVFSDDIDWVKRRFESSHRIVYVSEKVNDAAEELWLMSMCRYHVLSNSTFSWWGAWLDAREEKVVVGPEPWGRGNKGSGIMPEAWMAVSADDDFVLEKGENEDIRTVYIYVRQERIEDALLATLRLLDTSVVVKNWCYRLNNLVYLFIVLDHQCKAGHTLQASLLKRVILRIMKNYMALH